MLDSPFLRIALQLAALAIAVAATCLTFGGRAPAPDLTAFGTLLGTLLFASAILERALDVWLSMMMGAKADNLDNQIRTLKAQIESAPAGSAQSLQAALEPVLKERTAHQVATRKLAAPVALFAGTIISAIGLRSLQPLFDKADSAWTRTAQGHLFVAVDVLLTGTLLAGGSDGIHWIVALYRDWMDKNRSTK